MCVHVGRWEVKMSTPAPPTHTHTHNCLMNDLTCAALQEDSRTHVTTRLISQKLLISKTIINQKEVTTFTATYTLDLPDVVIETERC